jgi:cytochrome c oxidase subunit IV
MKFFFILLFMFLIPLSGLSQEEDQFADELIEENNQRSQKIQNIHKKLQGKDHPQGPDSSVDLFDEKTVRELQELLKKNPLSQIPPSEVKNLILEKASSRPAFQRYLRNSPHLTDCLVDLLRDDKAMPGALNIFLQKAQLKLYALIWLALFVLQWMFKKIFFKKSWGFVTRFSMSLLVGIIFSGISLGLFYRLFEEDLTPTVQIITKHWQLKRS